MAISSKKPAKAAAVGGTTTSTAVPTKAKEVTFEIEAPKASKVLIAGSFNNWRAETSLKKQPSGKWTATVALPPGTHQFRYLVDGNWVTAPGTRTVANPYGSANNVIEVK